MIRSAKPYHSVLVILLMTIISACSMSRARIDTTKPMTADEWNHTRSTVVAMRNADEPDSALQYVSFSAQPVHNHAIIESMIFQFRRPTDAVMCYRLDQGGIEKNETSCTLAGTVASSPTERQKSVDDFLALTLTPQQVLDIAQTTGKAFLEQDLFTHAQGLLDESLWLLDAPSYPTPTLLWRVILSTRKGEMVLFIDPMSGAVVKTQEGYHAPKDK